MKQPETKLKGRGGPGRGQGRPKGRLDQKTLDAQRVYAEYKQSIMKSVEVLLRRNMIPAMGCTYVYKKVEEKRGKAVFVEKLLVEDPHEIEEALNMIDGNEDYPENGKNGAPYYYIVVKDPDWRAIESLMNRIFGKAKEHFEFTGRVGFGDLESMSNEELLRQAEG